MSMVGYILGLGDRYTALYIAVFTYQYNVDVYVLVIVRKSSCTRYNGTRGGVEIVIQYEAQPSTVWSIETRHECHYIQYSLISVL